MQVNFTFIIPNAKSKHFLMGLEIRFFTLSRSRQIRVSEPATEGETIPEKQPELIVSFLKEIQATDCLKNKRQSISEPKLQGRGMLAKVLSRL